MNECIFCRIAAGTLQATKVYEDANFVAFLDINPVSPGHTLVIPKKHCDRYEKMLPEEAAEIFLVVHKLAPKIASAVGADSYNIGVNSGLAAGQAVFHTHVHIMPRLPKDGLELWLGQPYKDNAAREDVAKKIRSSLIE